jgi:methyltransferase family protein
MSLFVEHARRTELYRQLCGLYDSPHGNLLEHTRGQTAEAQVEFLRWGLHLANPRVIIETGTNKGLFAYLVSLVCQNVTIHTFDADPRAAKAVGLINKTQRNVEIVFHRGDSRRTLPELNVAAEFAWIDGGHEGDVPLRDLMECYRLAVPYVAVDDTVYPDVSGAVQHLIQQSPYRTTVNPFLQHDTRKAVLLRLVEANSRPQSRGCELAAARLERQQDDRR